MSSTSLLKDYLGNPTVIGSYYNISGTTAGTTVKSGDGFLFSITFNAPTATGVITLYDNVAASGTVIAAITIPSSPQPVTLFYNIEFQLGLTVVVATASQNLTITYR